MVDRGRPDGTDQKGHLVEGYVTKIMSYHSTMKRSQLKLAALVVAVAAACVAVAAFSQEGAPADDPDRVALSTHGDGAVETFDDFVLQCPNKRAATGDIESIGITSAEEAKVYPSTPEEAARRLMAAEFFPDFHGADLGKGIPVPPSDEGGQAATQYEVLREGQLIGLVTVADLGFGGYGAISYGACS